ncbi:MAG TPA: heparan-alpha-glucosaminide N-acetyltransferase domain-containing protein [Gemmatimonadaceae bacterium]|nr:heparan-alpha-glucosaminide N-acetyltransferase domain-containing protein [Gemmatimonadaceae bacterium]
MTDVAAKVQAPAYVGTATPAPRVGERIESLDFVRGVVMILMAIDHVRVYAGVPAGGPTPGVFFTRWITHFVAPGFVFLAGTAAYLHGRKLNDRSALSTFLITRGLWLVLLELTVIRVSWTFNFDFASYMLAGVIWMLGWCMALLGAAVYLPLRAIGAIGVGLVVFSRVLASGIGALGSFGDNPPWLLKFLFYGGEVRLGAGGPPLLILYVIVPWIGVMMAGYAFGAVMELSSARRTRLCIQLGVALVAAFLLLRGLDVGDQRAWRGTDNAAPALLRFLGTSKYPASLDFLLMTVGPLLVLLGLAERWRGSAARVATTFGRVPFFYYLLHIPVIHAAACIVSLIREGQVNPWLFGNHPVAPPEVPPGYRWSLALLYLVFAICVVALYFPCRWFASMRATRKSRWLSYL